jgi:TonB family protein
MKSLTTSLSVHAAVFALALLLGAAFHKVVPVSHYNAITLVAPSLPAPSARPVIVRKQSPVALNVAPRVQSHAERAEQPEVTPNFVKLDTSSALALPQTAQGLVKAGPVARLVGFGGQGTAKSGATRGNGKVIQAGFEQPSTTSGKLAVSPTYTAPVITQEPRPRYTSEALLANVQGEVTLQVTFRASGRVEVLGIVSGLGYGLDEEAIRVAQGIQFTPATRDGAAVNHTSTMHVLFQLG